MSYLSFPHSSAAQMSKIYRFYFVWKPFKAVCGVVAVNIKTGL
jgi:hypothetical protein